MSAHPSLTPEQVAAARQMRREGMSYERIGKTLGVAERTAKAAILQRGAYRLVKLPQCAPRAYARGYRWWSEVDGM